MLTFSVYWEVFIHTYLAFNFSKPHFNSPKYICGQQRISQHSFYYVRNELTTTELAYV